MTEYISKELVIAECRIYAKDLRAYIKHLEKQLDKSDEVQKMATAELLMLKEYSVNKGFRVTLIKEYLEAVEVRHQLMHGITEQITEH